MMGFGLQVFALVAIGLTLLLAAYAVYIRIKSYTYTERRFSFVALWSCTTVITLAILTVTDVQLVTVALSIFGINVPVSSISEKILVTILAGMYCYLVREWALNWNGLLTEQGKFDRDRDRQRGIVKTGLSETIRILRRGPQPKLFVSANNNKRLSLSNAIDELPFQEQIKLLVEAKWSEFDLPENGWVGEAHCWQGIDRAYNRTILVACGNSASDFNFDPLAHLAKVRNEAQDARVLCIFRHLTKNDSLTAETAKFQNTTFDIISFDDLVSVVANFDEYRRSIEAEFKHKRLPDANFAISDVLAPTRIYVDFDAGPLLDQDSTRRQDKSSVDFETTVFSWLEEQSDRQLALLGEYGQGKSTAALALTYNLLFDPESRACRNRIPILIRLTGRSPSNTRLAELLGAWGAQHNLSGQALLALHFAGRLFLIFDAFDEMANVTDRTARFEHFDALWEFASPGAKILFTGRPNFFLDDEELKEVLGITKASAVGPYCEALRVAPFNVEQIARAVNWLPSQKQEILVKAAQQSRELREVCCRPSLLYLIAHLWNRNRLDLKNATVNSAAIIREFISYSMERQVEKQREEATARRPERQFLNLTKSELDYFTSGIAVAILTEGRQNSIARDVFETRTKMLYESIPSAVLPTGKDEVGSLALSIHERFSDLHIPAEACVNAVRTHGVIEHDFARPRHYRFSHKSFCEVLAAEVLKNSILVDDDISAAIERSNSVRLVDLAEQPQIVEFVADFLSDSNFGVRSVTYEGLYNRIFPSSFFYWKPLARIRSIISSTRYLARERRKVRTRLMSLAVFFMAVPMAIVLWAFWHSPGELPFKHPWLRSFEMRIFLYYGPSALAMATTLLIIAPYRRRDVVSKFDLINRLCELLERKGHPIYRTKLEKAAQKIASSYRAVGA